MRDFDMHVCASPKSCLSHGAGGVYYVNESAHCTQCFGLDYSIIKLLYYEEKNILVTVTENLLLTQHTVLPEGETKEILKVSFSRIFVDIVKF